MQLPDAASKERTEDVMKQLVDIAGKTPGVWHATGITGQSFVLNAFGSNFGSMFVNLNDYSERRDDPQLVSDAIANHLRAEFGKQMHEAQRAGLPAAAGPRRGPCRRIHDDGRRPRRRRASSACRQKPKTWSRLGSEDAGPDRRCSTMFRANVPQFDVEPDLRAVHGQGQFRWQDFADTLQIYQGSLYVNDFNLFGRTWQVIVQAEQRFRDQVEDLFAAQGAQQLRGEWCRSARWPASSEVNGPLVLTRYNMYPAASINGTSAPGVSSAPGDRR